MIGLIYLLGVIVAGFYVRLKLREDKVRGIVLTNGENIIYTLLPLLSWLLLLLSFIAFGENALPDRWIKWWKTPRK